MTEPVLPELLHMYRNFISFQSIQVVWTSKKFRMAEMKGYNLATGSVAQLTTKSVPC